MAPIGDRAARVARAARKRISGLQVSLHRGDLETSAVATIGRTRRDQQSRDGVVSRVEVRDYLIDVSDYRFDSTAVEPQHDDEIREAVGDRVHVYRVVSPGGAEAPFRYSDRHRITWRIHTRLIDEFDDE